MVCEKNHAVGSCWAPGLRHGFCYDIPTGVPVHKLTMAKLSPSNSLVIFLWRRDSDFLLAPCMWSGTLICSWKTPLLSLCTMLEPIDCLIWSIRVLSRTRNKNLNILFILQIGILDPCHVGSGYCGSAVSQNHSLAWLNMRNRFRILFLVLTENQLKPLVYLWFLVFWCYWLFPFFFFNRIHVF